MPLLKLRWSRTWSNSCLFYSSSSLLYWALNDNDRQVNWCGFYFVKDVINTKYDKSSTAKGTKKLILGPFQGKIACTEIEFGKGVCGMAADTKQIQLVPGKGYSLIRDSQTILVTATSSMTNRRTQVSQCKDGYALSIRMICHL